MIKIDFSYCGLDSKEVVEFAVLSSGRIVAVTEDDESFVFDSEGKSPKGSYLVPWPICICKLPGFSVAHPDICPTRGKPHREKDMALDTAQPRGREGEK